jgi:exopolyphosphatase / guanosine-5'-triphosphate,3'-diphosphate pyrophosphatase
MQEQGAPIRAAIDIGSNTIHVVVARSQPDNLEIVADEQELVRIGESVTATGEISSQKLHEAIAIVQRYQDMARQHGAESILAVATEAIRKAHNGDEFLQELQQKTGLHVQLISGDAEAVLTFYGATYELARESHPPAQIGVIDLGGGSTELITAKDMQITWRTSLHMGSGQLHDRYLASDPPTHVELENARAFVHSQLQNLHIPQHPSMLLVTGSSAPALLRLAQQAFELDVQSDRLTQEDLMRCEGLLDALPAQEVTQRYKLPLERARVLPAGAVILHAMMGYLGVDEMHANPHGLRQGVLLAHARYGEQWLEQVNAISSKQGKASDKQADTEDEQEQSFVQFGRRLLKKRAKKFLSWSDKVLKHEDPEAVHKMRVASRRLRAALDAYETCSDPKPFKKAYRGVKKLADSLGTVRDTDVMLQGLHTRIKQVPGEQQAGVQWLIDRLDTYHQQQQKDLDNALQTLDQDALKQQIASCIPKGALHNG